jgi:hypothetical protein
MRSVQALALASGLACALLSTPGTPAAAEETKGHASGSFASRGTSFGVSDAFAFRSRSTFGDDEVIAVAVSNAGFNEDFIGRYRDRRYLLDNYFRDEETALVYFEFSPAGAYQGLSYYLGSGNGCGYCSGGVESTVKLAGGRLVGKLTSRDAESEREFAVEIDVPVARDDFGRAQGAGGGEPGAAYLVYHRAVSDADAVALGKVVAGELAEKLERARKSDQIGDLFAWLKSEHPATVKVTEAWIDGDRALVLTEGEGAVGAVTSEVILARADGAWRVEDEMVQSKSE